MRPDSPGFWWDAEKGEVHRRLINYVATVEQTQAEMYERFVQLEYLYDPFSPGIDEGYEANGPGPISVGPEACVIENVVASNVDTVYAQISTQKVRARFMTDGATWSEMRRAKRLEFYTEGLTKLLDLDRQGARAYKDAEKKGSCFVKVWPDFKLKKVRVERILPDDIIVDEAECRGGCPPRQIHHRMFTSRVKLQRAFPKYADQIDEAQTGRNSIGPRYWAQYRPLDRDEVVAIESWWLPDGDKDGDYYVPGRHVICADGVDLLDEEYHDFHFPIAKADWVERDGYMGISLNERIAGHQRHLNKSNWQIDRYIDQYAVPRTFVPMADARLAVATISRVGTIIPYKVAPPQTVTPQAVSAELLNRRVDVKTSAFEETGVSQTAAMAKRPAGIESAVGLREYRDQTTIRFAPQEAEYERFQLRIKWLALFACKRLGKDAPKVLHKTYSGRRKLGWDEVDMDLLTIQMEAASNISRTPAGRMQQALEWAQAGVITIDEWRMISRHPDLEAAMSKYTSDYEDIERCIEEIFDGDTDIVPEPYQNLKMGIWHFQKAYNIAKNEDAPEEVCETLRQWIDIAAYMVDRAAQPPQALPGAPQPTQPAMSAFAPESIGVAPV
jgi:hypothetical protein